MERPSEERSLGPQFPCQGPDTYVKPFQVFPLQPKKLSNLRGRYILSKILIFTWKPNFIIGNSYCQLFSGSDKSHLISFSRKMSAKNLYENLQFLISFQLKFMSP